jgi:hypothetical protein
MTTSVIAVVVLVVAGLPLAWALTRSVPLAVVVAPLAGAVVSTVAVLLMLALRGPLVPYFLGVFAASVAAAWLVRRAAPVPGSGWREVLLLAVPLVPPFLLLQEPLGWDVHSIWWLHSAYFAQGGDFATAAIGNPALQSFSHPDYPPLASAPVAVVWRLLDSSSFRPALAVNVAVTYSVTVMLAYAVRRVTAAAPALVSVPVALGAACAAWYPDWTAATMGYSDVMCGAAFVAGAVLLLLPRDVVLLGSAALMKNEGTTLVLAFAVAGTVRYRRDRRRLVACWLPFAAAGVWSVATRLLGVDNDLMAGGRFSALVRGDAETWGRLPVIQSQMAAQVRPVVAAALLAAVLGALFLRTRRGRLGIRSDGWIWALFAAQWAVLTLIYLVTPYDVRWHLMTSVNRVTIVFGMLACVSAACWVAVALAPAGVAPRVAPDHPGPEAGR